MRRRDHAQVPAAPYLVGWLAAWGIVAALLLFAGFRVGFSSLANGVWSLVAPPRRSAELELPSEILHELRRLGAVVEGAGNPTGQHPHDTLLVRPDARFGWVPRPGATLSAFVLKTSQPLNLDPPVLYLVRGAALSERLAHFLERESRLRYTCSVDAEGFRTTVPTVEAERRILMVGDSVLFGVGVDDDQTLASHLQQRVGPSARVVNAGVGGYSGEQAFELARALTERGRYDALIYVACHNDFMERHGVSYASQARQLMERFASLKPRVGGRIIVLLQTYLEYAARDVLLTQGWPARVLEGTDELRATLPALARELGIECVDWEELVQRHRLESGTILATFALYADHAHFSPLGNRLAAERLYDSLRRLKVL